jgi:cytochrome oxidase assembly protein ShyY1
MPRFLFTPRWILLFGFAVVVAAVCVRLGIWQLHRLEERRAYNAEVTAGLAQPPATAEDLFAHAGEDPASLAYRRAEATGSYDTSHEVLLYGRALDGQPGNHVLTPLVLAGGEVLIVDRGWAPIELDTPPVAEAAPPGGTVTVTGVLLPGAESGGAEIERDASGLLLSVREVDLAALARESGAEVEPLFLQLETQSPPQPGALPRPAKLPELTEGPHLSYAIQWFTFATIALVGFLVLVRREVKDRARVAERAASG